MHNRPLSPHLSIYKKQLSSVFSALHRISGISIFIGWILLAWIFIGMVMCDYPQCLLNIVDSMFFAICVRLFGLCVFYHLVNGIRHLIWDAGYLMSIKQSDISAYFVAGATISLWFIFWFIV